MVPPGLTSEAGEAVLIAVTVGANTAAIELALVDAEGPAVELGSTIAFAGELFASTAVNEFTDPDEAGKPQITRNKSTTVQRVKTLVVRNGEDENDCFMAYSLGYRALMLTRRKVGEPIHV
jgi:hypothetical protein